MRSISRLSRIFRLVSLTVLISVQAGRATAQKLPNVQSGGRYISAIKIDGISGEWPGGYQAYNKNTTIYYTIGNDENNLYLTVQATDMLIIRKIINGSIKLSINLRKKESITGTVAVAYPVYPYGDYPFNLQDYQKLSKDSLQIKPYLDSLHGPLTQQFRAKSKDIEITGLNDGQDTLVSVYNELGIKVSSAFSDRMAYTCEWSIPLKLLGIDPANTRHFYYNIKLPAFRRVKVNRNGVRPPPPPPVPMKDRILYSATDFWGEYTLKTQ